MIWTPTTIALAIAGGIALGSGLLWLVTVCPRRPKLERDWSTDCAVLPTATIEGRRITLHNVRHFVWRSSKDFDETFADEVYDLDDLVGVWYVVEHFHWIKGLAHTMLSFEFTGGRFVACSFETRRVKGQRYHPWTGLWRGYELLLVWGGEEDIVRLRTNGRKNQVYLFPCNVPDGKGEAVFRYLCERANTLAEKPEWYNTLSTTCTTSLVQAVNKVTPGRIPFMWRLLLPGHSPRAAHRLGLIKDQGGYGATLAACAITAKARAHEGTAGFSAAIRA